MENLNQTLTCAIVVIFGIILGVAAIEMIDNPEKAHNIEDKIITPPLEVVMGNPVLDKLNYYYNRTNQNEFAVCINGTKDGNYINISEISYFKIGDEKSVKWNNCEYQLGYLHKHPSTMSEPSHADVYLSYRNFHIYNNSVFVIMYENCKFNFMTSDDWYEGQNVSLC